MLNIPFGEHRETQTLLAGDIGGTKTRLGVLEIHSGRVDILHQRDFPSADFASFEAVVGAYAKDRGGLPKRAAFGVAGPVKQGRCQVTNLPWVVDTEKLTGRHGLTEVQLLNDVEANGWGLAALGEEDFHCLHSCAPGEQGNLAVIAAGTGLGEGGLYWNGAVHRPFASEGGHASYAPATEEEIGLLRYLQSRYGHVSWERVLSGSGLVHIYEFLRQRHGGMPIAQRVAEAEGDDPAAAISAGAHYGGDPLCVAALDRFVALYGAEAGNQALKLMATGGLFIGGGIAPRILSHMIHGPFLDAFFSKGRMRPLLEAMPVHVVLNDRAALLGPAVYLTACRELPA